MNLCLSFFANWSTSKASVSNIPRIFLSTAYPTTLTMHAQVFLTTNLLSTIDNAFRSRVNIHLLFDLLSPSSRRQLWQKFMERLPKEEKKKKLSAKDLNELAKWELNGREIKNSIKTVRNWCIVKDLGMNLERLESGIKNTTPQATKVDEDDSSVPASKRKRGSVSKN